MTYDNCLSQVGQYQNLDITEVFLKRIFKFVKIIMAVLLTDTKSTRKQI